MSRSIDLAGRAQREARHAEAGVLSPGTCYVVTSPQRMGPPQARKHMEYRKPFIHKDFPKENPGAQASTAGA